MKVPPDTDPEMDDGRRYQDADALHQISHHVDEGRPHAGVAAVTVASLLGCAAVAMRNARLVEDQHHPARDHVQTRETPL